MAKSEEPTLLEQRLHAERAVTRREATPQRDSGREPGAARAVGHVASSALPSGLVASAPRVLGPVQLSRREPVQGVFGPEVLAPLGGLELGTRCEDFFAPRGEDAPNPDSMS